MEAQKDCHPRVRKELCNKVIMLRWKFTYVWQTLNILKKYVRCMEEVSHLGFVMK